MRHQTPETQRLQISIALKVDKNRKNRPIITTKFLQSILDYRLDHGSDPKGIKITGVIWDRDAGTWMYKSQHDIDAVMDKLKEIRSINPEVFSLGSVVLKSPPASAEPTSTLTTRKRSH